MINSGSMAINAIAIRIEVVGSFATAEPIVAVPFPLARYRI